MTVVDFYYQEVLMKLLMISFILMMSAFTLSADEVKKITLD